ncbi:FtsX-like permease family protein [Pediococcus siamensis]|uniref:FtsX-like permease family protein n=1 Tax=Pediococcus siamensis TaxID=381829 RepID=UPI0039A2FB08
MLFKLAFVSMRDRWRDYLVLFSGLIISAAIFYMFEAIATNQALIKGNISFGVASVVFQFGSVLLAIITLIYIVYADSFLMNLREHDYGLFIMLGGKRFRLGLLIFLETLLIGMISTIIGILAGIGLTGGLSSLLMKQLGVQITHFQAFNGTAILVTVIFFVVIFFLAALINQYKLLHKTVLKLLKGDTEADQPVKVSFWRYLEGVLGLILIAIGYWAMGAVETLVLNAIPIALVTIVLGTYCLYHAFFQLLIHRLSKSKWAYKGLNGFTFSQLSFRIRDYTKMLTVVSILFALALGAITVGMGYHRLIPSISQQNSAYDLAVLKQSARTQSLTKQLDLKQQTTYQRKVVGTTAYFIKDEFEKTPFRVATGNLDRTVYRQVSPHQIKPGSRAEMQLIMLQSNDLTRIGKAEFVSRTAFNKIKAPISPLTVLRTNSVSKNAPVLKKIADDQTKQFGGKITLQQMGGAYPAYQVANLMFGGLEFVGFFLGLAFLTMLASCLMFKILSGARADQRRYHMLNRLGTRQNLIKKSIRREIGVLFGLPGILGIIHVLFGLRLFAPVMAGKQYAGLETPFIIFLLLYLGYYLITLFIYEKLVVPTVRMQS